MLDLQKDLDAIKRAAPWYCGAVETLAPGDRFTPALGVTQSLPIAVNSAAKLLTEGKRYGLVYRVVPHGTVDYDAPMKFNGEVTVDAVEIVGITPDFTAAAEQLLSKRKYKKFHIGEDCRGLSGTYENECFFDCLFDKLNSLKLINCGLRESRFKTSSIKDALDFTVTLDCHSFTGVELSPLLIDLILVLITLSQGNDEKRRKLVEVVGREKFQALRRILYVTEAAPHE